MQHEIVRAEIERYADGAVGELLRGVDRRIRPNHDRREGNDRAPAELAAALAGILNAAVIAPFAGVVHVGLALLQQPAVADEWIETLWPRHIGLNFFFLTSRSAHSISRPSLANRPSS